jgi:hypothetical protein
VLRSRSLTLSSQFLFFVHFSFVEVSVCCTVVGKCELFMFKRVLPSRYTRRLLLAVGGGSGGWFGLRFWL